MAPKRQSGQMRGSEVMQETLRIVERGRYNTSEGGEVRLDIRRLRAAVAKTTRYADPCRERPRPLPGQLRVRVWKEDAFEAATRLNSEALGNTQTPPLVLDFASDSNPGGGCKGDQQGTQEESLCRRSNLYPCLEKQSYPIPRFGCIYAPDICVFRGSEQGGYLLKTEPLWLSVVAAALPNCGGDLDEAQRDFVRRKIRTVLDVAVLHHHSHVVLGAWGCGAFGNDAHDIANIFRAELELVGGLDVVFAVIGPNFERFKSVFEAHEPSLPLQCPIGNIVPENQTYNTTESDVEAAEFVPLFPPDLIRDLSVEYESKGASMYDVAVLDEWKQHRDLASEAKQACNWLNMASELRLCLAARPDWAQGHIGLHIALLKNGEIPAAWAALHEGHRHCLASLRQLLERGHDPETAIQGCFAIMDKLQKRPSPDTWDSCEELGVVTLDQHGSSMCLYHGMNAEAPSLLESSAGALRLLFLDVDGVLNVSSERNCGSLVPELMARINEVLRVTDAVVVLSSSWRSFGELRPLIIAALPHGRVIGQTALGYSNHTRPREIADFLEIPEVKNRFSTPPEAGSHAWAVVDDMDLLAQASALTLPPGFEKALRRRFVRTDKSVGLDEASKLNLIQLFMD